MSVGGATVVRMIIDCDSCTAGPRACGDCVVTFLTIAPRADQAWPPVAVEVGSAATEAAVELDAAEERALGVLAASGLVPPLRMAPPRRAAEPRERAV